MQKHLFSRQPPSIRALVLAVLCCVALLFISLRSPQWLQPARDVLFAAYNPIYALANYPMVTQDWFNLRLQSQQQLRRENLALEAELLQADIRLQKMAQLSAENLQLQALLDHPYEADAKLYIARIIGTDVDPLRHIVVINRGYSNQIKVGQMVVDAQGIMGQVIDVYPNTSRVMLLSDKQHSISVQLERSGMRAIASGTGDMSMLSLQYVPTSADIEVGEKVYSSGLAGHFAAGYLVGIVTKVNRQHSGEFAQIRIKPAARLGSNQHVAILVEDDVYVQQ